MKARHVRGACNSSGMPMSISLTQWAGCWNVGSNQPMWVWKPVSKFENIKCNQKTSHLQTTWVVFQTWYAGPSSSSILNICLYRVNILRLETLVLIGFCITRTCLNWSDINLVQPGSGLFLFNELTDKESQGYVLRKESFSTENIKIWTSNILFEQQRSGATLLTCVASCTSLKHGQEARCVSILSSPNLCTSSVSDQTCRKPAMSSPANLFCSSS